jgi:hypothetical protein
MAESSDDFVSVPRELHSLGCSALAGASLVMQQLRTTLAEAEQTLAIIESRQGLTNPSDALQAIRDAMADLLTRRAATLEMCREFRACDPDLTPVRSPSQAAIEAFRSSQDWSEKAAHSLKGSR